MSADPAMSDPRLVVWGWGALEADFWRFYQLDLSACCHDDQISWRRFRVLVAGLPEDSAWQRFLADKKRRSLAAYTTPNLPS